MLAGRIIEKTTIDNKEVVFRYLKYEDIEGLMNLTNFMVEEKAMISSQKKIDKKNIIRWVCKSLLELENKKKIVLVAEMNGQIIGKSFIKRKSNFTKKHSALLGIILKKEMRGKGIGGKLINIIVDKAVSLWKIKIVEMHVLGLNILAQKTYKKIGFNEVGKIKKGISYYGQYVDEIIMVKYL